MCGVLEGTVGLGAVQGLRVRPQLMSRSGPPGSWLQPQWDHGKAELSASYLCLSRKEGRRGRKSNTSFLESLSSPASVGLLVLEDIGDGL